MEGKARLLGTGEWVDEGVIAEVGNICKRAGLRSAKTMSADAGIWTLR